ncbi:hypothetical protein [Paenibacillus jilunlii]|uniref:Uncharacterized protein n=1 Tax=Paenibacillus jilunlii TaxID=682956 RepID=A0ABR5T1N5_9BACL|nr:hypothetical protein [Paenibacillus jilunlii]KWX81334.1 hypothetical protein AML91_00135 [Paenibacillus jilunlii]
MGQVCELPLDREAAKHKAEAVLLAPVLRQNRQPGTRLYGHWPLGLNPLPRAAADSGPAANARITGCQAAGSAAAPVPAGLPPLCVSPPPGPKAAHRLAPLHQLNA